MLQWLSGALRLRVPLHQDHGGAVLVLILSMLELRCDTS